MSLIPLNILLNHLKFLSLLLLLVTVFLSSAMADPKIYSPIVKKGEGAFEYRGNTTVDDDDNKDGSQRHVAELEYGVTDWWHTAVFGRWNKPATGSLKYALTAWENIIQLTEKGKYWLDAGLYLEYKLANDDDDSDQFEGKLLFEKRINDYQNLLNLTIEQDLEAKGDDDLVFEYAWRTRKKIAEHMKIGFEAFGKLGELGDLNALEDQQHRIGPVFYHEFHIGSQEVEYDLAWLVGLTGPTPDHTFRWKIEIPFNF